MELRHLPGEVLALAGDPDGVDPIPSDLADNCNYWYRTANYYELLFNCETASTARTASRSALEPLATTGSSDADPWQKPEPFT
jgi:hypothetical protein